MAVYSVEERHRRVVRSDRVWKPQCMREGCSLTATHEVKQDGHRFVWRGCRDDAYAKADELNGIEP